MSDLSSLPALGPEPEPEPAAAASTGNLVEELRAIRRRTRTARHGYRLPLLAFGLMIAAGAPLYIEHMPQSGTIGLNQSLVWEPQVLQAFGGGPYFPRSATPNELAFYWLAVIALGAAVVGLWYRRHAQRTGVRSRVLPCLLTWAAVSALLVGFPLVDGIGTPGFLGSWYWSATQSGAIALLVVGLGLCVLAATERSLLLGAIALAFTAVALNSALALPENTVFQVLSWFGVSDEGMPFELAPMATVLFPAAVLLLGAAVAGPRRSR